MASDSRIDMFAYDVFHSFYLKTKLISHKPHVFEIYEEECLAVPDYFIVCDETFFEAVKCRFAFYYHVYVEEIHKNVSEFSKTCLDFDNYIDSMCSSAEWFGILTVFERLLGTCAFVWVLIYYCQFVHFPAIDKAKYSHICWARFFDKYSDEFYEQGGWLQLQKVANGYISAAQFLKLYRYELIIDIKAKMKIYADFKMSTELIQTESTTKSWIKFNIEQLRSHNYTDASLNLNNIPYYSPYDMENILQDVIRFCNPSSSKNLAIAADCVVQTKYLNDGYLNTNDKEIKWHLKPFETKDTLNSDNSNFSTSKQVQVGKREMPSKLIGSLTNVQDNFGSATINNHGKITDLNDIFPEINPKSCIDDANVTDVSIETNSNSLNVDYHSPSAIPYQKETLEKELDIEVATRSDRSSKNKTDSLSSDIMKNTPIKSKCTNKAKINDTERKLQEMSTEKEIKNISQSGNIKTDLKNISTSQDKKRFNKEKNGVKVQERKKETEKENNEIKDLLKMILVLGDESRKSYLLPAFNIDQ